MRTPPKTKLSLDKILEVLYDWRWQEWGKPDYFYFHSYGKDLIEQYIEQLWKTTNKN